MNLVPFKLLFTVLLYCTIFLTAKVGADDDCGTLTDCGACTAELRCMWCENDNVSTCVYGTVYDTSGQCASGDWRWKQCKVNGKYVFFGGVGLVGLILLTCCCCCCCCARRRRNRRRNEERRLLLPVADEVVINNRVPTPITDKRREELRAKYASGSTTSSSSSSSYQQSPRYPSYQNNQPGLYPSYQNNNNNQPAPYPSAILTNNTSSSDYPSASAPPEPDTNLFAGSRGKIESIQLAAECPICEENPRNVVLLPCGHILCKDCSSKLWECPFCKEKILETKRIYL